MPAVQPASSGPQREELVDRLNQALRRPAKFGGLGVLRQMLEQLAATEPEAGPTVWVPDSNARMNPPGFFRAFFPDLEIHVIASQHGEDAFRRGWLRLDRTLDASEFGRLIDSVLPWSEADRSIHEVVAEYGPASIVFGDPDMRRPKTLGYATFDREAPFVVFHFDAGEVVPDGAAASGAALLGVRAGEDFFRSWATTPRGIASLEQSQN